MGFQEFLRFKWDFKNSIGFQDFNDIRKPCRKFRRVITTRIQNDFSLKSDIGMLWKWNSLNLCNKLYKSPISRIKES